MMIATIRMRIRPPASASVTIMTLVMMTAVTIVVLGSCSHAATLEAVNGTVHEMMASLGGDVWLPCTAALHPHTSPLSNQLIHNPTPMTPLALRHRGIQRSRLAALTDVRAQHFIQNRPRKGHGFSRQTPQEERPILVLWYKDGLGTPIYSYDSRSTSPGRTWTDSNLLGDRAEYNVTLSSLRMTQLLPTDQGMYRCRVDYRNAATQITRTNLTVIVPPSAPLIVQPKSQSQDSSAVLGPYNEGDELTLRCEVKGGQPTPQVHWYIGKTLLDDSFEAVRADLTVNTLTLSSVDRGLTADILRCVAKVPQTMPLQTSVNIVLNLSPSTVKIIGSRGPLTAGKTYMIECEATGSNPPAQINWYLNDQPLPSFSTDIRDGGNVSVSTLRYEPEEDHDTAVLICKAASPALRDRQLQDSWTLVVNYIPSSIIRLGKALRGANIRAGDDVFLECQVRAKPWIYRLKWRHNGVEVHHNISRGIIVSNQSLVLQHVTRTQAGQYTCVGSNTEGDGESEPLHLQVRYAPVCKEDQTYIYDAARNEEVTVTCELDAFPSNVSFRWRFNNSGEMVDISQDHIRTMGLESSLSYVARTDLDYGTLLCWGNNSLGVQRDPCLFKVIPAELPRTPINCSVLNDHEDQQYINDEGNWSQHSHTEYKITNLHTGNNNKKIDVERSTRNLLVIKCIANNNLELPLHFNALVYDAHNQKLLANITNSSVPEFYVRGLSHISDLDILIDSINSRGRSNHVTVRTRTSVDIAEKRTAQVRHNPSNNPVLETQNKDSDVKKGSGEKENSSVENEAVIPMLAVAIGVIGSVGLVAVVATLLLLVKRHSRSTQVITLPCSLAESPDSNPDVVPPYSESEILAMDVGATIMSTDSLAGVRTQSLRKKIQTDNLLEITYLDHPMKQGPESMFPRQQIIYSTSPHSSPAHLVPTSQRCPNVATSNVLTPPLHHITSLPYTVSSSSSTLPRHHPPPPPVFATPPPLCPSAGLPRTGISHQCHHHCSPPLMVPGPSCISCVSPANRSANRMPRNNTSSMNIASMEENLPPPPPMFQKSSEPIQQLPHSSSFCFPSSLSVGLTANVSQYNSDKIARPDDGSSCRQCLVTSTHMSTQRVTPSLLEGTMDSRPSPSSHTLQTTHEGCSATSFKDNNKSEEDQQSLLNEDSLTESRV